MPVSTKKFSEFAQANLSDSTNQLVGVGSGQNIIASKVTRWTLDTRPSSPFDGLTGYNTDLKKIEYYDIDIPDWVQLSASEGSVTLIETGTGLVGGPITDIGTISFAPIAANSLWANPTGVTAVPSVIPMSTFLPSATPVTLAQGGTNANLTASNGGIFYSTATAGAILSGTATARQMIQSGSNSAPSWSTTTWPATSTANRILYSSANNVIDEIVTGNNGVLVTGASGIPSISSTIPSATQDNITRLGTIVSGVWNGTIIGSTYGGTGINNGSNTATFAGNLNFASSFSTVGNFTVIQTYTAPTNVTFPPSGTLATTSQLPTPAALTKTDDTNVTLTLGGTPATSLLQAVSLTMGWTGQLSLTRGGTNNSLTASAGGIVWSDAGKLNILSGTATANQLLLSGSSATPTWSTTTYPTTNAINTIMYASSANVLGVITPVNSAVMISSSGGVPSFNTTLPAGLTIPGYQSTITPAALTKTDDTNVTLTLGGTPATALLQAASLTLGWTGQLSVPRGGTGLSSTTAYGLITGGTTTAGNLQNAGTGTTGQFYLSGGNASLGSWTMDLNTSTTIATSPIARGGANANITSMTGLTGNYSINPSPATGNTSGNTVPLTAGEGVAAGDVCYMKSDGKVYKADATDPTKFPARYMAAAAISTNNIGPFMRTGIATLAAWTWTVGAQVFLSTTGSMTQAQPAFSGNCIQVMGIALTSTIIDFDSTTNYIVHT